MISLLPSSSGFFQNNVMESSVISTGSGDPGFDGCSVKVKNIVESNSSNKVYQRTYSCI